MSYEEKRGNLFNSKAEALVNTVNCEGFMGKGIALEFRRRFPAMFAAYKADCTEGRLEPGSFYVYGPYPGPWGPVRILNFAIKNQWRYPSKLEWIDSALHQFTRDWKAMKITAVAFPWMGAANGGIPLEMIQAVTRKHLAELSGVEIEVYEFDPDATDPLFEELKAVIGSTAGVASLIAGADLAQRQAEAVWSAVRSGRVRGMSQLAAIQGVGAVSLDKLYAFLAERVARSAAQTRPEPSGPAQQLRLL